MKLWYQSLARETESKDLDRAVLAAGVDAALADPGRLRYWVAELGPGGPIAGQADYELFHATRAAANPHSASPATVTALW